MGTRADFYIGTGPTAEWIGSITYDGYPDGTPEWSLRAGSEADFRERVEELFSKVQSTWPSEGWPWPWEDSRTTDYAYAWCADGCVRLSSYGRPWETLDEYKKRREADIDVAETTAADWPNMSKRTAPIETILAKSGLVILCRD